MDIRVQNHNGHSPAGINVVAEERFRSALDRFSEHIRDVTVRLRDLNGPKGGVDQECHVGVRLRPSGEVFIDERSEDMNSAIGIAADRAAEAVRRQIERGKHGIGAG